MPVTGRIVALGEGPQGRNGLVSVRGAQVVVALDLVPDAGPGDSVLVQAGVALARVGEDERTPDPEEA